MVFNQHITNVELLNDGIHFKSIGNDPSFYISEIELPNKSFNFKIEISTPKSTIFQVFHLTNSNSEYNEENSIRKSVTQGYQKFTLPLNSDFVSGKLRIDPGNVLGDYIIHKIEIYK
jgi:hypothetical protein